MFSVVSTVWELVYWLIAAIASIVLRNSTFNALQMLMMTVATILSKARPREALEQAWTAEVDFIQN